MKKRGSLNLSINAIVILILAITMLGLGLSFMRNIFGSATQEFEEVSGTIHKQMIDQMKEGNKEIDLSSLVYDIKQGEKKQIYIGFKNVANEAKNFTITGVNMNSLSGSSGNCGLESGDDVMIEYKQTATKVLGGDTVVLPINIKTSSNAEKDSCFYEILIDTEEVGNRAAIRFYNGLLGWWRFDEGYIDSSGNSYDGNCGATECPILSTGFIGDAYDFDGINDYISPVNSNDFNVDPGEARSIEARFKGGTQAGEGYIVWKEGGCIGWYIRLETDGDVRLNFNTGNNWCSGYSEYSFTADGKAYDDNEWHHVVGVIDRPNNLLELYVDGKSKGTAYIDNAELADGGSARIGTTWDVSSAFDGIIDEVRIYDYALSSSEVYDRYNGFYDSSIQLTVNVN